MSLHQLQRAIFDIVGTSRAGSKPDFAAYAGGLSDSHKEALLAGDIPALAKLGVHPSLLISFAAVTGQQRSQFMHALDKRAEPKEHPRWRKS